MYQFRAGELWGKTMAEIPLRKPVMMLSLNHEYLDCLKQQDWPFSTRPIRIINFESEEFTS